MSRVDARGGGLNVLERLYVRERRRRGEAFESYSDTLDTRLGDGNYSASAIRKGAGNRHSSQRLPAYGIVSVGDKHPLFLFQPSSPSLTL